MPWRTSTSGGDSIELGDRVLGWAQRQALVDLERFDDLENRLSNESTRPDSSAKQ